MHENPQYAWSAAVQAMITSQQAQGDRSHRMRQTRRVFLPVSTGLSHTAGHGDDRRPSRPWSMDAGCTVDKPQTTIILHLHSRLVTSFWSTCFPVLAFAGGTICRFLLVGLWSARVRVQQRSTRNVSQVAGAFQARRGQRNSTICRIRQLR
jgi:hypothetical protein